ncbi:MAG: DUF3465 domain-containing protein [Kiritimatiellia bacterium]
MKKLLIFILFLSGFYFLCMNFDVPYVSTHLKKIRRSSLFNLREKQQVVTQSGKTYKDDDYFRSAFENRKRNVPVRGSGKIVKILPSQFHARKSLRFIVSLKSGQLLEVKHAVKNKKEIPLEIGDRISFDGIYNYTRRGGEIVETDTTSGGWIRHNGRIYQ